MKEQIKKVFGDIKRINIGLTQVTLDGNILTIDHRGNMGNSIRTSVNPNLKKVGLPELDELSKNFQLLRMSGSPDYHFIAKYRM